MHAAVIAGLLIACLIAVAAGRAARRRGPTAARRLDRAPAATLLGVWVWVWAYYLMPARCGWQQSLPLHVCHIAGLAAPITLLGRRRTPRAIVHFWGLGLSGQAFITPVLYVGPGDACFWVYWPWHGAIVVAAAYDLFARRYRPTWRDWRLAVAAGLVYAPLVFAVDWRLCTDYGWLGRADSNVWTPLSLFGRWPQRVPEIVLAAFGVMAALAAVWPRNWPGRRPAAPEVPGALPVSGRLGSPVRSAA